MAFLVVCSNLAVWDRVKFYVVENHPELCVLVDRVEELFGGVVAEGELSFGEVEHLGEFSS